MTTELCSWRAHGGKKLSRATNRRVHLAGITTELNETWLLGMARELTNHEDGFLLGKRFLIMDQDAKFSKAFRQIFSDEGIAPVQTSPYALNMNAHMERFFGSLKSECLNRLIFFGER